MGHCAPSRPGTGRAQLKALADPFGGRAQLRRDEAMVRLPAGSLPRPRAQPLAASLDLYRDKSASRPGAQRRLSAARIAAAPVAHRNLAPTPTALAKTSSREPLFRRSNPATRLRTALLSGRG